jgi:hypothetical protein
MAALRFATGGDENLGKLLPMVERQVAARHLPGGS